MAKTSIPDNIRLASQQKKVEQVHDLMKPGMGLPWEDRGSVGSVVGYFKTVKGIMFSPVATLEKMGRPETSVDARWFSIICCCLWALSAALNSILQYFMTPSVVQANINGQQYAINTALAAVLAGGGAYALFRISLAMFQRMTAYDMPAKAPVVLVHNVMAYLLAPSVIALIPGGPEGWPIGAGVAMVWIVCLWIAAGKGRLHIRTRGVFVAAFLTTAVCAVIGVVAWLLLVKILWLKVMGNGLMTA